MDSLIETIQKIKASLRSPEQKKILETLRKRKQRENETNKMTKARHREKETKEITQARQGTIDGCHIETKNRWLSLNDSESDSSGIDSMIKEIKQTKASLRTPE